jgi:outer membrane lipoprotein-sorting protein
MIRTALKLTGAAVLLSAFPPTRLPSQDPWPVLDAASAAYRTVQTFSADFTQVVINPLVGEPDTTRGKLYQEPPGLFAMRFTHPKGDRIVADGRSLWLYTPSTTPDQVIRTPIPKIGTTGPNLIGQFVDHARERYAARYIRADTLSRDGIADVIALDPKDKSLPYRGAVI